MEKFELELTKENLKETILKNYLDNNKRLYTLARLIDSIENNTNICIDGDWGCGKTFFINQFIYLVKNREIDSELKIEKDLSNVFANIETNNVIIYYDAWKNDNHPDAFESIIFNILNEFPKYKDKVEEFNNIKDILIGFGKNIINKCSYEIIDFDNIKTYEELAEQIVTAEEKKERFKELLQKILGKKRMILIIDELDRCNPIYASKVLETIKHFYDFSNITIIYVSNNKELANTMKKQYGENFNGYEYLNKFYDFVITLDNDKNIEYSQKVLNFNSSTYLPHNISYEMFKKYNFSYRDCNRFKTMYEMVKNYIERDKNGIFNRKEYNTAFDIILPIIIAFKIKDLVAYRECLNGGTSKLKEALKYIKNSFEKNYTHTGWLKEISGTDENEDEIEKIIQIYNKFKDNDMYSELFNECIKMSII